MGVDEYSEEDSIVERAAVVERVDKTAGVAVSGDQRLF